MVYEIEFFFLGLMEFAQASWNPKARPAWMAHNILSGVSK
jgi:hypothetical protein